LCSVQTGDVTVCPACGADCAEARDELSAYTLTHGGREFIHQHAVDAYAAQHAVGAARTIGPAFGLIGLYLALEKNFSGREVQRAHMKLGQRKREWPRFTAPRDRAALTVVDVMKAEPGEARDAAILKWAAAVWDSWAEQHEAIRQLFHATI